MAKPASRTKACTRADALVRLAQAESLILVAELVLDDATDVATPGVAASLAVLAGIAASDAACCAKLKLRSRGDSHHDAVAILETVAPHGAAMAKDLKRLIDRKDDSHYGLAFISAGEATKMVAWASRLTATARTVVES